MFVSIRFVLIYWLASPKKSGVDKQGSIRTRTASTDGHQTVLGSVVGIRVGFRAGFSVKFLFFSVNRTEKPVPSVFGPVNRNRKFRLAGNTGPRCGAGACFCGIRCSVLSKIRCPARGLVPNTLEKPVLGATKIENRNTVGKWVAWVRVAKRHEIPRHGKARSLREPGPKIKLFHTNFL